MVHYCYDDRTRYHTAYNSPWYCRRLLNSASFIFFDFLDEIDDQRFINIDKLLQTKIKDAEDFKYLLYFAGFKP